VVVDSLVHVRASRGGGKIPVVAVAFEPERSQAGASPIRSRSSRRRRTPCRR
jgi:hypothetical protein